MGKRLNIGYRLDLAGAWLDQPFVSKHSSGPVITLAIHYDDKFASRSGLAGSTLNTALDLHESESLPTTLEECARLIFMRDNPPSSTVISGSQDAIGLVYPGLNKLHYEKREAWPSNIDSVLDDDVLDWLESVLYLVPLSPRKTNFDVLSHTNITAGNVEELSIAAKQCWDAILARDINQFGKYMTRSFIAQYTMLPKMLTPEVHEAVERYKSVAYGYKITGAGGGGYFIVVSEKPIENSVPFSIRRE